MPENENLPVPMEPEVLEPEIVVQDAQTAAEISSQVATAKRYPRSLTRFRQQVLEMATLDQETAEECWYALPRAGKLIEGPSIRFAEIVLSAYGNLRGATRIIKVEDDDVTAQAVCMDLEKNVGVQIEVKRRIRDKCGKRYNDDMILTTSNAGASIALRNAIFRIVPKAIYKNVLDEVKAVAAKSGKTMTATREAIVQHFAKMGVTTEQLSTMLTSHTEKPHKGIEDISMEDVIMLRGVANAIKDEQTTVAEVFGQQASAPAKAAIPMAKVKPGKPQDHTPPGVRQGKPEPATEALPALRAKLKKLADDASALADVDVTGLIFQAGVDNIDRCEDFAALKKAIGFLEDELGPETA